MKHFFLNYNLHSNCLVADNCLWRAKDRLQESDWPMRKSQPLGKEKNIYNRKTLFIFFPGVFSYPFNNLYVPGAAWVFTPPVLQHSFPLRRFGQKYFSRPVRNIWNIGGCHADKSINVMISNKILKDQDQTQIGIRWC